MNLCIVCGARPNFIKVAPLIRALDAREKTFDDMADADDSPCQPLSYRLLFTGAADDPTLEPSLFDALHIRRPDICLGVTAENLSEITGQAMQRFESYLQENPTDTVVVVDDLASTMAVAIVAKKNNIRLAHIAAGTRSFNINMPKEVNRLVIDGLSDILFTAGASNNSIVNREGGELSKVYMVGNVLMDNLRFIADSMVRPRIINDLGLGAGDYVVFTLNRKALIADGKLLADTVRTIMGNANGKAIIAPLRPRAAEAVRRCMGGDGRKESFHIIDSLPYLEFEWLTAHACGIITDSGNVSEEATFNQVPCITLNDYTEHIETVKVGSNVLVGGDQAKLSLSMDAMTTGRWKDCRLPERWDGHSAERIVQILAEG